MSNLEVARKFFDEVGLQLLATVYKNNSTKMPYVCRVCGYKGEKELAKAKDRKQGCPVCGRKKSDLSRRKTRDYVGILSKMNATLIEVKGETVKDIIVTFACNSCHKEQSRTWESLHMSFKKEMQYACVDCLYREVNETKRKYTLEDVHSIFKMLNITLKTENYSTTNVSMPYQCDICGYEGSKSLTDAISGRGCFGCAGKVQLNYEEVLLLFESKNLELLEKEFVNERQPMKYRCRRCGYEATKDVAHLKRDQGCKRCANRETAEKRRFTIEKIREFLNKREWKLHSTEYRKNSDKIIVECEKGHSIDVTFMSLRAGAGCRVCSGRAVPTFEQRTEIFHNLGLELLTEEYDGAHIPIPCRCVKCNKETQRSWTMARQGYGCHMCFPLSKGEGAIARFLDKVECEYTRQYKTEECKNIKPLPFDFAIFDCTREKLMALIEFDGAQHRMPIEYFGGEEGFLYRKTNDDIKNRFCENKNIPLLRIHDTEIDDVEEIVSGFLEEIMQGVRED